MPREVHVGDIGTKYKVRIQDENGDFDPSSAATKELIFKLPGYADPITVDATVESEGSPADVWYLAYTVPGSDFSPGSPTDNFHREPGKVKIQARLTYADGKVFTSDVQTKDDDGQVLKIYPNLDS